VRSLEVVLTTACNLRCAYCFQDVRTDRSMSWGVLRSALDLLLHSEHPNPELTFYGGEPLLELPLMIRAVEFLEAERGANGRVAVSVFTNGTLLDRGTRRFLARHGVETQISFDGVEAAQQLRAPGTFGRLDRALSRLRDEHPDFLREHCRVAITLSSRNLDHLAESFANLVDRGVGEIVVSALVTHDSGWHPETIEELAAQIEEILNLSIEHFRRTGEVPFAPFRSGEPGDPPADGPPTMCSAAGTTSPAVDVDGQVYGCVMFAESYQTIPDGMLRRCLEPMRLGNIRAPDFGKRLEAYPAAAEAAKIFTNKEEKRSSYRTCRGCRFVNQCSVCPVSIGHIPGNTDPNRVPDLQCAFNLAVLAARDLFLQKSQSDDSVVASATL
jgi:sulfatase maturation enzyme AslB (radical SAM superfamily)